MAANNEFRSPGWILACKLTSCFILLTDFGTVFVFALGRFVLNMIIFLQCTWGQVKWPQKHFPVAKHSFWGVECFYWKVKIFNSSNGNPDFGVRFTCFGHFWCPKGKINRNVPLKLTFYTSKSKFGHSQREWSIREWKRKLFWNQWTKWGITCGYAQCKILKFIKIIRIPSVQEQDLKDFCESLVRPQCNARQAPPTYILIHHPCLQQSCALPAWVKVNNFW